MKSLLVVVLLAAAASAAVVSNEVLDVANSDELADVDVNQMPEVVVSDVSELTDISKLSEEELLALTSDITRRSISQGTIGPNDSLAFMNVYSVVGVANHTLERNISFSSHRITAILVLRQGAAQDATPSIASGGVGHMSVVIRLRTAVGRGYNYMIMIYTR